VVEPGFMKKVLIFALILAFLIGGALFLRQAGTPGPAPAVEGDVTAVEPESSTEVQFYQTLDTAPAPVLSPDEALQAFHIAPGFEIELVAAEPLVEDPVAMAWDEHARLYVVEMRGYMPDAYGNGSEEPVGQVVRLEDTDGDGQMDKSEIVLGGMVNPRAVAVVNEGVLIAEPPNLWLCAQPTRESLCESKTRIGDYATDVGAANVEHMENGLLQGLDNWMYNAKSNRRMRIVNGEMVVEEGLTRGQWGLTKDNYGRLMYNHNSTWIQADLFQGEDMVVAGLPGRIKGTGVNLTNPPKVFSVRVNPGVNRAYLDGTLRKDGRLNNATGVSGLVAYRGDQFPRQFANDVFVPESAGNVVAQFELVEEGMQLQANQRTYPDKTWGKRDFLGSTDERFRPVDAMNGPDGSLYIIDMYRGIIQDNHFLTEQLREQIFQRGLDTPIGMGRIWRVRHSEGNATEPVVLAGASTGQLLQALSHDNGWVRDTAQRLLIKSTDNVEDELSDIALGENGIAALHAIWTLHAREELKPELVERLLQVEEAHRQIQALRAGYSLLGEEKLLELAGQLQAAPLAVVVQLVYSLSDYSDSPEVRATLLTLLKQHGDSELLRHAVVRAAVQNEIEFLKEAMFAGEFSQETPSAKEILTSLGRNATLGLRQDISSGEVDEASAGKLLSFVQSIEEERAWQELAFLLGMKRATRVRGFVPAQLSSAPGLFADMSIGEDDPRWEARLQARRAFTWPGDEVAQGMRPLTPTQRALYDKGEAFYVQCGACHGDDGKGVSGLAPALADASWVTGPPERLARIILQGMSGPVEVNGVTFDGVMPPHGHVKELDDDTLSGLMTYIRRSFGNSASPISPQKVRKIRADSSARKAPWTAEELLNVTIDRGYGRYVGEYSVSFITISIFEKPDGLYFSVPMTAEGKMEPVDDTLFRVEAGDDVVDIEFIVDKDGSVNKLIMHRKGERIPVNRKD
jgi:mono/diheme cytochrome c family protein/glucose/arabinose dehydrogenase